MSAKQDNIEVRFHEHRGAEEYSVRRGCGYREG